MKKIAFACQGCDMIFRFYPSTIDWKLLAEHMDIRHGQMLREQIQNYTKGVVKAHYEVNE